MPTEKGMFVLEMDASVVAISGILHQERDWNGRTVLRPIAYGSREFERYRDEVWRSESGNVRGDQFRGKMQGLLGECSLQVACG